MNEDRALFGKYAKTYEHDSFLPVSRTCCQLLNAIKLTKFTYFAGKYKSPNHDSLFSVNVLFHVGHLACFDP